MAVVVGSVVKFSDQAGLRHEPVVRAVVVGSVARLNSSMTLLLDQTFERRSVSLFK